LECGGKRSATPFWFRSSLGSKAPSSLRFAGALQKKEKAAEPGREALTAFLMM
jgi:hypothetical protein